MEQNLLLYSCDILKEIHYNQSIQIVTLKQRLVSKETYKVHPVQCIRGGKFGSIECHRRRARGELASGTRTMLAAAASASLPRFKGLARVVNILLPLPDKGFCSYHLTWGYFCLFTLKHNFVIFIFNHRSWITERISET